MIGKLLAKRQENTKISLAALAVKSGQFGSNPIEVFWPKSTVGVCSLTVLVPGLERKWKILFLDKGEQCFMWCSLCRDAPSTLFYLFILVILKKAPSKMLLIWSFVHPCHMLKT